jgi:23S rRNA U2552 (ribose-2'-O)-methylase RlmE/FtsJ
MDTIHPWRCVEWNNSQGNCSQSNTSFEQVDVYSKEWIEDTSEHIKEVDELKESIKPFDKTDMWDLAKRITNPYELVYTTSSRLGLPKSTSCFQPLSRSFFKMVEILQVLQFFERHKQPKLRSLQICEGPGGFIEAFLYSAEQHKRTAPNVYAMTLKPTHTMIPGWRRASFFVQKHKNISLLYGPTKTGNIYEPCNQEACKEAVGQIGAHLVTADGGFDFSEDFYAQEKSIFRLLVCSSVIILKSVAFEGDCVLKVFDCNSPATRDLLTLLSSCFQSWTLYKPATSRPCNSEWYFLGKSAIRHRDSAIQILMRVQEALEHSPIDRILRVNPMNDFFIKLQEKRCIKQKEALKKVFTFCKEKHTLTQEDKEILWKKQRIPSIHWCTEFHIPTLFRI